MFSTICIQTSGINDCSLSIISLRGGDSFTFKGNFDDTGVIHIRQIPDLNNTICPICLRRGKDMKDCSACPDKFQRCGDAFCNAALGENSLSCPEDCGCGGRFCGHNARRSLPSRTVCGNRICEKNESCSYENIDAERMEIISFNEGALVLNRTKLFLGDELNMTSCESGGVTNEYLSILGIKYMIYFNGTFINGSCNNYRNYSCQEVSVVTVALPNDPTALNLGGNITGCNIKHSKIDGCAVDCGYCNDNKCGNGVCDAEESCHTCPYDCHENACEVNAMAISTLNSSYQDTSCTFVDLNTITCKTNDLAAYNHSHYTNIILSIDDSRYLADGINMLWSNQMLLQRYKNEFQVTNILPAKLTGSFAHISIFGSHFLDLSTTVTVDDNEAFFDNSSCGFSSANRYGVADRFRFSRHVRLSNPSNTKIHSPVFAVEFDTIEAISANHMLRDCSVVHLRDFSWGVTGYEYWLDPFSCNSTSTKVWIRAKSMEANERTSLRLVYGLKFAKNLPDKSLDGANIFDYFEEPKSPNPQNIYYRNLDSNKATCLQDPNLCGKHQTSFSRFRQQLKRPYAIEASVSSISGSRPTISVVNSSIYEKQHISYAGFYLQYTCQGGTEGNHHFGAKVNRLNQILSTPNSDCEAHLESLAVENREYDFVYFGSMTDKEIFNWIAKRQYVAVDQKWM